MVYGGVVVYGVLVPRAYANIIWLRLIVMMSCIFPSVLTGSATWPTGPSTVFFSAGVKRLSSVRSRSPSRWSRSPTKS